jgi:type II secretory pathway pseudopilin PulG
MRRRWFAMKHRGEQGFTIVETMVAIGIMFAILVSLAYAVTAGLSYQRHAKDRQTANGLANQLMEQVRGLPYEAIQSGMLSTDLSGDSNIASCDGGTTKKLFACTAGSGSAAGTAETIVQSPSLSTTSPLVPHRSSTSPNANITVDGVTYTWATYVSQGAASGDGDAAAYRVTVQVAWTTAGVSKTVRLQSLFWSPTGCRSTETHPYAAPCQAFFYGRATVPAGSISIVPTTSNPVGINNTTFDGGELSLGEATASIQQEQVVQSLASFAVAHADVTTSGVTTTYGAQQGASSADSDPNTSSGAYERSRCGTEVTCATATGSSPSSGAPDRIAFSVPTTSTGESAATVQAATAQPCPPSNVVATAENDTLACAGASVVQANDVYAQATIGSTTPSLGSFDIVRVSAPSTTNPAPLRAITHRVANPTTDVCSPPANTDGCTTLTANRAFGTIAIGGLPSGLGTPTGWSGGFVRIENYADSATVSVGTNAPYPTTSASTPAGQLRVYNSVSGTYDSYNLNSSLTSLSPTPYSRTVNVSGKDVTATFTLDGSLASNSSALKTSTPTSTGTLTRTEATAQVVAPIIVVRYELSIATVGTVMDLTVTINLGTIDMDASYQPQPTEGS